MMIRKLLLIAFLFSVTESSVTRAQDGIFAAGITTLQVLQDVRDLTHGIIAASESSMGNVSFRTRQQLELLLGQVEGVAQNTTKTLFSSLDRSERQFFIDVKTQLDTLERLERLTLGDVEQISRNVSNAIVNLPFSGANPIVFDYRPLYVPSGGAGNDDAVNIHISGALLASGEPSLRIGGIKCKRDRKIDASLAFSCDSQNFVAEEKVGRHVGKLLIYQKLGFFRRITGSDPREYRYDISITSIPKRLGIATPMVVVGSRSERHETRTQEFKFWNPFCYGPQHKVFEFNAQPGWRIDPNSITHNCDNGARSSCNGLINIQSRSFGLSCTIANNGSCGYFAGHIIYRDGRGHCYGGVNWREIKYEEEFKEVDLKSVELYWGKDKRIALPEGTRSIQVLVDKVDSTSRVVTNHSSGDPWFSVEFNIPERYIVIAPKSLEQAMSGK